MTDDPLKRFRGDLDALVIGAGVDIHADPDVYATLTTLVRLVATHHDRMRTSRSGGRVTTRDGGPVNISPGKKAGGFGPRS